MYANNFKILQALVNDKCKNEVCTLKAKFLREHYANNYWAKQVEPDDTHDVVYSNTVFFTRLENAINFDEMREEMNLPTINDTPWNGVEFVFFDCKKFGRDTATHTSNDTSSDTSSDSGLVIDETTCSMTP